MSGEPAPVAAPAAPGTALRQPRGLYLLFTVEMWERFSFYGMRAILALFIADAVHGGLGWSKASAARIMGVYGMLAYTLPLAGGYLADRFLGTHRAMLIGGVIIAIGHFVLALPFVPTFFLGLALVVIGTGFFKANVSTMVGQLYQQGDTRRDSAFTVFYMGVNVGAFFGQIVCGYFGESERWGWHYGFAMAGVGMLLSLAFYVWLRPRYLGEIGALPNRTMAVRQDAKSTGPLTAEERDCVAALLVIILFTIPFWMAFEQAASSMNFFASERTDRVILGFRFPASWLQSVNPLVLISTAPLFAMLWTFLARRHREPSTPAKMAAAMVLVGAGFVFMVIGAARSEGGRLVSPLWLVAAYALHTFGELCLSPIGLSLVTKLAPLKFASVMMGLWFFATGISELLAGLFASITDRIARGELYHLFGGQADFYFFFVVTSGLAALGLVFLNPWLRRRMHGRDV